MWLKAYLNLTTTRPEWAIITDLILEASAPDRLVKKAIINPFLQRWSTPTRGIDPARMNNDIQRMIKIAKKYDTNLAAIRITPQISAQLPAWYHLSAEPRAINTNAARCLIEKHRIGTVAELIKTSARLRTPNQEDPHRESAYCQCRPCQSDRNLNCLDPNACAKEAKIRIDLIPSKLNPTHQGYHHGNLSLTRTRKEQNARAKATNDAITFDPTITCKNNLAECFRIFTDPTKISNAPARRYQDPRTQDRHPKIEVYTDGACFNNGKLNARSGSGIWFGPTDNRNRAIKVPGETQSNQAGEIVAIIAAIDATHPFQPLEILSDSKYAIYGLTTHLGTWEDRGWIGIKNAPLFRKAAHLLRCRTAPTTFRWVKGHDGNEGNEGSDLLAKEGAMRFEDDPIDMNIPTEFDVQGAKLSALTQAVAYRGIKESYKTPIRPTTEGNLNKTREAILEYTGCLETDASIWTSLRKQEIQTKIRQFLFKAMHGTQKVGKYWTPIVTHAYREHCQKCGLTETMEHILINCREPPVRIIWTLTEQAWPSENLEWPRINIGLILGSGCLANRNDDGPRNQNENNLRQPGKKGAGRLATILMTEAAHLIWVLRCERVIRGKQHSDAEITTRWKNVINMRLTNDRIIATKIKRNYKFTTLVIKTWESLLKKDGPLPLNWIEHREVLVGRRPRYAPMEDD